MTKKPGRNDPCPCGSGKKYKQCCWGKEVKKTYTASGKRKFKATLLSGSAKSQGIFGKSAATQKMPDEVGEPGALLKFKQAKEDYRKEQAGKKEKEEEKEAKKPSATPKEKMDLEKPFEPTKKDFKKKEKG